MSENTPLIIRGRVQRYGAPLAHGKNLYADMEIEILEILRGRYGHQTLTVLGDPGHLCRPYISATTFPINGEFLLALQPPQQQTVPLSGCGEYFLPIRDGNIPGKQLIQGQWQPYSISYPRFRDTLASP